MDIELATLDLVEAAKAVLAANDLGTSTKPAPDLYPHQWNWDSCFISIGLSSYAPERAAEELRSLLKGQWRNGLVPQIIFNPAASGYFPGPEVWQSQRSPDAPHDVATSGITQPPILATAAMRVWRNSSDPDFGQAFLREVYPKIRLYHAWMYGERDPDQSGLVTVVHPWESGLDNSPPYLDAGERVHLSYRPQYERLDLLHVSAKNRPTNKDYDLFVYLLEQMRAVNWDQKRYLQTAPLQVEDVMFNSVLCRANLDLVDMAEAIGEDADEPRRWHERTADAINRKLWDDDHATYYSFDRVAGRLLRDDTIAAFHTLYGGVAPQHRAQRIVKDRLLNAQAYWPEGGTPIPTTSMNSAWYNPENYWLGPVWMNTNWMVLAGLRAYGFHDEAQLLADRTLELTRKSGFREYFHPQTGEGFGTNNFSWSAALTLDLLYEADTPSVQG